MVTAPIQQVLNWIDALNQQDVDSLVRLTEPEVKIRGPKGDAIGIEILKQWQYSTRLLFTIERVLCSNQNFILEGKAAWRDEKGKILSEVPSALFLSVSNRGSIALIARYDEGSSAAILNTASSPIETWQVIHY